MRRPARRRLTAVAKIDDADRAFVKPVACIYSASGCGRFVFVDKSTEQIASSDHRSLSLQGHSFARTR
jgi:hypothetical protein